MQHRINLGWMPLTEVMMRTRLNKKQIFSLIKKKKFPAPENGFWNEDAVHNWILKALEQKQKEKKKVK